MLLGIARTQFKIKRTRDAVSIFSRKCARKKIAIPQDFIIDN